MGRGGVGPRAPHAPRAPCAHARLPPPAPPPFSATSQVCYYRDKQSINKFQVAKVTAAGVVVGDPFALDTDWGYEGFVNPSSKAVGTW